MRVIPLRAIVFTFFSSTFLPNSFAHADEIIVTATKTARAAEELPLSIDVLSGARLDAAGALNSAEEITQLLSGVQAAVANGNQIAFQIRGIGAVDHQALTPTAAAVYMDGVFLSTNVQTGPLLYDLERVEVLKGPQGSLYGRNASSGAINFITVRPAEETSGYLNLSYGRFSRVDATGAISMPLSESLSGRLAGRVLQQDAALDNVSGPERAGGERDEFGLRGSLLWTGANVSILARAHYEEDNGVNPAPRNLFLSLNKHEISVGADGVQDTDNEFYGASIEAEAQLGAWDLFSLTAVEGYNQQYGFDFDGAPAPFADPTLNANLHYDRDFIQWSEEARAQTQSSIGSHLFGVAAAIEQFEQEYLIWCGELDPQTLLGTCRYVGAPGRVGPMPASPGVVTTLITDIEQDRVMAAVFTYNEFNLTNRLTLTLGGRFTHETIDGEGIGRHVFDDGTIAYNNRDGLGPAAGENTIKENRFSGNAALSYRLNDTSLIYASFSNGYKSGGFNGEVQNNATHFQDEGLFKAETVNAFEAGYKGQLSETLSFNGAVFYQRYKRPQARIFVNFPLPDNTSITSNSLSNLDRAESYGVEGAVDWTPFEGLNLGGSVTVLETEIHQTNDVVGNDAIFDGNPLPFASDVTATLYGRYEASLQDDLKFILAANAKYTGDFYLDAEGLSERSQNEYVLIDAEANIRMENIGLTLGLWGRNLLSEDYAVSGFEFIGYNVFIGAPRTYGFHIKKTF